MTLALDDHQSIILTLRKITKHCKTAVSSDGDLARTRKAVYGAKAGKLQV